MNNRILSREGAKMYFDICRYLGNKAINRYEYKKISKDVFQMAVEAEARGESINNVFPDGGKGFCDDVLTNCLRKKWYEILLETLFCVAGMLAVFTALTVFFAVILPDEGESVNGMYITVWAHGLIGPLVGGSFGGIFSLLVNRNVFFDRRRKILFCVISFVALTVFVVVSAIILSVVLGETLFTFNWVAVAVTATVLAIICWTLVIVVAKRNFRLKN